MNISQEDKNYLIEQIEAHIGERPFFYLKFCSEKKYAEDVAGGNLFGNTAEYFRKLENESGEQGQGDKHELISIVETQNITMLDPETGNVLFTAPSGHMRIEFGVDKTIPIVCFVGIPLRDMVLFAYDENHAEFRFPFTNEDCKAMKTKFGEHCTIIGARELEARIERCCAEIGTEYIFDKVIYCSQNTIQRMEAFNQGSKERFLYKNKSFEYQREFRLAIAIEMPEDHFIRLGKIESAKVFLSDEICNFGFSIEYKTVLKEKC